MNSEQHYNKLRAQALIGEFEKRNFEGYYCETKADALNKLLDLIPKNDLVSCGGSLSLHEIGLNKSMEKYGYNFIDPNSGAGTEEKERLAHEALSADWFLMSSNAISMSGELVNADGIGNRTAALIYGPKHVLVVAGMNKLEPDIESAIRRVKTQAAQKCLTLFKQDYASYEELRQFAEMSISNLTVTSRSVYKGRIKIILVGETLGL